MDFLLAVEPELAEAVYWATADLLNLEVDLLFFDTPSAYFELDEPDPAHDGETGFRSYGRSKDHRPDLPRSSSASPSPAPGFRSGSASGLATGTTTSSSARSRTSCAPGSSPGSSGSPT